MIKRTVPPTEFEDYDIDQLSSLLDNATVNDTRGRISSELQQRIRTNYGSTLGHMIRMGCNEAAHKGYKGKPEYTRMEEPDDDEPEDTTTPTPPPLSLDKVIREIEDGRLSYSTLFHEILGSGWDYIAPPKFKPFVHGPAEVEDFVYTHRDDPGTINDFVSEQQINFTLKIIKTYRGWKYHTARSGNPPF